MCGYSRCHNCEEVNKTDELNCIMLPKKTKAYTEKYTLFDYKAEQGTGIHKPNLIVAHCFDGTKFCFKLTRNFGNA